MIHSEDCQNCMYGITVKCKSGDEFIACDMVKCQEEKKKKGGDGHE